MPIALISNSTATSGLNATTTAGIDTTGADLLIIALCCDDAYNDTVTDSKGNTWTQLTSYTQTNVRVRMWYSIPTSVGTAHTFTAPGVLFVGTMLAAAFSGAAQTTPNDQQSGANGFVSTLQPGSITPSEDNELIWTHFGINSAGSPISIDSGFTELGEADFGPADHYGGSFAYKIQTTAAAVNPTWTRTNTNGCACTQVSFKFATAVTGGVKPTLLLMGVG